MEKSFVKVKTLASPEMEISIPLWSGSDMKQKLSCHSDYAHETVPKVEERKCTLTLAHVYRQGEDNICQMHMG
jgi:hypothetical protein